MVLGEDMGAALEDVALEPGTGEATPQPVVAAEGHGTIETPVEQKGWLADPRKQCAYPALQLEEIE